MDTPNLEPIRICTPCLEHNLITSIHIQNCNTCGQLYCIHAASPLDGAHCIHCLHDVNIEIKLYRASLADNPSVTKAVKSIKFGGVHYLFQHRKIATMSEVELELAIEYHQMIFRAMVFERDRKRNEKMHRNAGSSYTGEAKDKHVIRAGTVPKAKKLSDKLAPKQATLADLLRTLSPSDLAKLAASITKH